MEYQRMPESTPLRLFSFWWWTQAVHRGIVRHNRGGPDTHHHSSQVSAYVGGEDAGTASPKSHASTERPYSHAYRGKVLNPQASVPVIRGYSRVLNDGGRHSSAGI